jgi:hypothetical protein
MGRLGSLALVVVAAGSCENDYRGTTPVQPSSSTDLSVTIEPSSRQVHPGESATYFVRIASKTNVNADVRFLTGSLPAGVTATFAAPLIASTAPQQSTQLTLGTSTTTPATVGASNAYQINVLGRVVANGQVASEGSDTTIRLEVIPGAPEFHLVCDAEATIFTGALGQRFRCVVERDTGFVGVVDLSFAPFPEFVRVTPLTTSLAQTDTPSVDFTAIRGQGAPPAYNLTVIARSGTLTQQVTVRLLFPASTGGLTESRTGS